jgi:hypothetical protein
MSTIVPMLPLLSDRGRRPRRRPPATISCLSSVWACVVVQDFGREEHAATVKLIGGLAPAGIRPLADCQLDHVAGGSEGAADATEGERRQGREKGTTRLRGSGRKYDFAHRRALSQLGARGWIGACGKLRSARDGCSPRLAVVTFPRRACF